MSCVKGNALSNVQRYVELSHGSEEFQKLIADLPEDERAIFGGIVLPGSWYPVGVWNRLLERLIDGLGGEDPQSFRPVAEFIAEHDLTMIFKVLFKVATPAMIVQRTPSLWERYFDMGTVVPSEEAPTRYVVRLSAPLGVEDAPGRITCAAGVPAWLAHAVTLAGGYKSYAHERACRFRGAHACEIEVGWRG